MQHTSASLTLNENASPDVRRDFAAWFDHAVPDGWPSFSHTLEGPDDMPAHIKASLTGATLVLPVSDGRPRARHMAGDLSVRAPRPGGAQRAGHCVRRARLRPLRRPLCEHSFVRWDNLKVSTETEHALPGYREPAAIRTFDAPEAMDVRFYEVRARSILNRVPKASQMPRFGGRSTRTADAHMPASSASRAPPTPTSTSTPGGTSSARSSSRSTRRSRARGADAAILEARARRARHEHRSTSGSRSATS